MKFYFRIVSIFRKIFNIKGYAEKASEKARETYCDYLKKQHTSKTNNKEIKSDEKFSDISFRKMYPKEIEYLNKTLKSSGIVINKKNYKNFCFGTKKINGKLYSIISLYRISKGKRSDFRYVLIYRHTKNNDPNAKLKFVYGLFMEFKTPYKDNYYKIFKSNVVLENIWKKVNKLIKESNYERRNK